VKKGGADNPKESKWYVGFAIPLLKGLEVISETEKGVVLKK
jgi:hypothetical protein